MQGRILYICRQNNDFERFVAIADAVNKSHTQWLFHTQALERVKNRHLAGILADRKIPLWDPGKFCLYFKSYCGLNRLARTFKSRLIWKMGQWFLSRSEQNVKSLASTILNRLNPQVVFFCYTASDAPLPLYRELHAEVRKRKIPVFIASTGIAAYATLTSSRESIIPTAQLPGDVLLSPSAQDFEEYYLPEKTMKGESFSKLVAGDPRLAKPFVLKVRDYYQSSPTLKVKPGLDQTSAVVFGSNVPYLCEGRQEPQDLIVLRIVQWLAAKNVHKIFVRFHPQTSWTPLRDEIQSVPGVVTCSEVNSSELLSVAQIVISPPSSVLFEAMILGKKILVVDDFTGKTSTFQDYGVNTIESKDLITQDLESIDNSYSLKPVIKYVWGDLETGDCRGRVCSKIELVLEHRNSSLTLGRIETQLL